MTWYSPVTAAEAERDKARHEQEQAVERLARILEPSSAVWSGDNDGLVVGQLFDRWSRRTVARVHARRAIDAGIVRSGDVL